MTKKHFIALADAIRTHNTYEAHSDLPKPFDTDQLDVLANFCKSQNYQFNRERWLGYINGTNGPSGGAR